MSIEWHEANENKQGITMIAFEDLGKHIPNAGRIVGYNGILKGDKVLYEGKPYTVVMVSRLGDFGLSETGKLPYTKRVLPADVVKEGNQ